MTRLVSAIYRGFGPFGNLRNVSDFDVVEHPTELGTDDILLLHGGEDISPSLYNHPVHEYTGAGDQPSRRDRIEWALLQQAIKLNIPIVGICRGAQMLCAAAGGYLIQHIDHPPRHKVKTLLGEEVYTNSCHHQMQYPFDVEHEMLMWIDKPISPVHLVGDGRSITPPVEPEAVYYPKIRGFAPQWHPEWLDDSHPANVSLLNMINTRL